MSAAFQDYARSSATTRQRRFSFLLATPLILAAGVRSMIPGLFGPLGDGIGGHVLAGSAASFLTPYLAVRFLTKCSHTKTLTPFAAYCVVAGVKPRVAHR